METVTGVGVCARSAGTRRHSRASAEARERSIGLQVEDVVKRHDGDWARNNQGKRDILIHLGKDDYSFDAQQVLRSSKDIL